MPLRDLLPREELTGLLLCGGEGRRMGGNKPWKLYHDQPLYEYGRAILRKFCTRNLAVGVELEGMEFRADEEAGLGPLGGLLTGLRAATTEWCLCLAVDMPKVSADAVRILQAHRRPPAITPPGEPLLGLYHASALHSLEQYLASGQRSARGWLERLGSHSVEVPAEATWNCNTPAELGGSSE